MNSARSHAIRGSSHKLPVFFWLFALVWNGVVSTMFLGDMKPAPGVPLLAVYGAVGLFVAVGLFLLWKAVEGTLRYARYRSVLLELDPYPGAAGGEVGGIVDVPIPFDPAHAFKLALTATEHGLHGGTMGKNNNYRRALFQEEAVAKAEAAGSGTRLRFRFAVPAGLPASAGYGETIAWTARTADRIFIQWTVHIAAAVPGVDFDETFEIPVERSAKRATGAAAAVLLSEAAPVVGTGDAPSFRLEHTGALVRVSQPAWRKPGGMSKPSSIVWTIVFSLLFAAAGGAVLFIFGTKDWLAAVVGGVFLLFGIGMPIFTIGYLAHSLEALIGPQSLVIERRIGATRIKRVTIQREQIAAIEVMTESPKQRDGAPQIWYDVRVRTYDSGSHSIAEYIPRLREAAALRNLVASRLGMPAAPAAAPSPAQPSAPVATRAPAPQAAWVKWAGGAVVVGIAAFQTWPLVRGVLLPDRSAPRIQQAAPALPVSVSQDIAAPKPAPSKHWDVYFNRAFTALSQRRLDEAERLFAETLEFVEQNHGADHPIAALVHNQLAATYELQKKAAQREASLKRALEILEKHPGKEAKAAMGGMGSIVDKESVASHLGDLYWDQRRYADAYTHYERAYQAVPDLDTSEYSRNLKLAFASSGMMATACMLGKWETADRAMGELKQRYAKVDADSQRKLKYWIDTGEPRLKARKC